jgi:hypothetical protein
MNFASDNLTIGRQRATRLGRALELAALVVLILIFIWVAMDRIWRLRLEADRLNLVRTEAAIQIGLGAFVAEKTVARRFDEIAALDGSNPMALLLAPPTNYAGERSTEEGEKLDGYQWYFDTTERQLIYVVGNPDHFASGLPGRARAAFRLMVRFDDRNGNGTFDKESEALTGIRLAPVAPFRWIEP